jgi:hypothetical protein
MTNVNVTVFGGVRLFLLVFVMAALLSGCSASYVTPGGGVSLASIDEPDIEANFRRKPASPFPVRLAVVRVQDKGYYSHSNQSYGNGAFSVVTTRDVEKDEHFKRISDLPMIAGMAPLNRMVISRNLHSVKTLRVAASQLKTDMLLVYTFDTSFRVPGQDVGPLTLITLGFLPNKQASVTTTASAAIYDVRTGYIYGLCEATATQERIASSWSKEDAIERCRIDTETEAFDGLVGEFEKTWKMVLAEYTTAKITSVR